jgi:hypothetical protein
MIPEGRAVLITTTLSSDGRTGAVIAALEREALIRRHIQVLLNQTFLAITVLC